MVRAQANVNADGTSRRALLGASVALSAAAGVLPQLALPSAAQANTVLSADWEQVQLTLKDSMAQQIWEF